MVYEPLCSVGFLPQPAVVAADAAGAMIVVTATPPAATTATAPSTASQRGTKRRVLGAFTTATPLQMAGRRSCSSGYRWLFGGHARIRAGHGDARPSEAATETPRPGSGGVLPQQIQPVPVDYLPRLVVPQLLLGGRVAVTAMAASTARPPRRGGLRGAHWFTSARKPSSEHRSYDVSCQAMEISRLLCTRLWAEQRETYTR